MEVKLTLDNLNQTDIPEEGIVLFDKPKGKSSFYAVAVVRAKLKNQAGRKIKVGHTGTLDPIATGLLILLTGKMTKQADTFLKKDKVYIFYNLNYHNSNEILEYSINSNGKMKNKILVLC